MKSKEIMRRFSALAVTLSLLLTSATPALAEPVLEETLAAEAVMTAEESVEETEGVLSGSEDLLPEDIAEAIFEEMVEVTEETTSPAANAAAELVVTDVNNNEKTFELAYRNYTLSSGSLSIGVWSAEGGQDDLKWYDMTLKDGAYRCTVKVSDHKTLGTYFAHLYHKSSAGAMTYLCGETFEVHAPGCDDVEITNNLNEGTAKIVIKNLSSPSGISKVSMPIWVKSDRSDLKWYSPEKNADGDYELTLDIADHGECYGIYNIHLYATDGNGIETKILETSTTINRGEESLILEGDASGYSIKVRNFRVTGLKEIRFAIWTTENGMDDLEWYTKSLSSRGTASLSWMPSEDGEYNIYCYGVTKEDRLIFKKSLTREFAIPSAKNMETKADEKDGSFTIRVSDVKHADVISQIRIPVWSDEKQKDLVWYDAVKQADGSYLAEGSIFNHKLHLGTYQAKAYAIDVHGVQTDLDLSGSFSFSGDPGSVKAEISKDQKTVSLNAEGIQMPMTAETIAFAVWSEADGKDDLIWYRGTLADGKATATVNLVDHMSSGTYQVKAYAENPHGSRAYLCSTSFEVKIGATAAVTFTDRDEKAATFKVNIALSDVEGLVTGVTADVWCETRNGDEKTYTAEENEDGSWSFPVDVRNHKDEAGDYHVVVYAAFSNGLTLKLTEAIYSFDVKDFLQVVAKGNGTRTAILKNPSADYSEVSFPTWSGDNGQDDLVWYKGVKQSDGSWQATISATNHVSAGTFHTHCYADGNKVGETTFTFAESEMKSIGERKVDEYVNKILAVTGNNLRSVYLWVVNNINYEHMDIPMAYPAGYTRQQYYMVYGYEHRTGNCFIYAALFYWCALKLGYSAKLVEGRYLRTDGNHGQHGWVEIYMNGRTYVCDPEIAWQSMLYDTYMKPYGSTALTYFPNERAY